MKITSITNNDAGQMIAEVVELGKTTRVAAFRLKGLVDEIKKVSKFITYDDIYIDLNQNYKEIVAKWTSVP